MLRARATKNTFGHSDSLMPSMKARQANNKKSSSKMPRFEDSTNHSWNAHLWSFWSCTIYHYKICLCDVLLPKFFSFSFMYLRNFIWCFLIPVTKQSKKIKKCFTLPKCAWKSLAIWVRSEILSFGKLQIIIF